MIANNKKDTSAQKTSKIMKRKAQNPKVDKAVFEWICYIRNLRGSRGPLPVSRSTIQARANSEATLLQDVSTERYWYGPFSGPYQYRSVLTSCNNVVTFWL